MSEELIIFFIFFYGIILISVIIALIKRWCEK